MSKKGLYLAFDIGASSGVKLAVFNNSTTPLAPPEVCAGEYNENFDSFSSELVAGADSMLESLGKSRKDLAGIGIASAGILSSDGGFKLFHNRPQYNGYNLRRTLEEEFGVPAAIANDADAGGLAEWSVLKLELLYWVFGGGWGGVWIDKSGTIRYPSTDWDGRDESLHYSNEPGYSIGIDLWKLRSLFSEVGASFELFERQLQEDPDLPEDSLIGPGGNPETMRAEVILSGPGRCRLFRAVVGNDDFYENFLDIHERTELTDPAVAGAHISKLSRMRVESAVSTDRLYGKVLAEATRILLKQSEADGLPSGAPICLGGKPSYALPYFGPSTQRILGKSGFMNYLRPSVIDERGSNANLVGAAELARRAEKTG
jgi:hypothetical protein